MRSRLLAIATAAAVAALLAPTAAGAEAEVDVQPVVEQQEVGICLKSRLLPRDYCIFIDQRG